MSTNGSKLARYSKGLIHSTCSSLLAGTHVSKPFSAIAGSPKTVHLIMRWFSASTLHTWHGDIFRSGLLHAFRKLIRMLALSRPALDK